MCEDIIMNTVKLNFEKGRLNLKINNEINCIFKFVLKLFVILNLMAAVLVSNPAFAQEATSVNSAYVNPFEKNKLNIILDGTSVLLKGFGIKAVYRLQPQIAVGGFYQNYKLRPNEADAENSVNSYVFDPLIKVNTAGVIGEYYLNGFNSEGVYFSGALVSVNAESTVDNYNGLTSTSSDSKSGYQIKAGYQFLSQINQNLNIVFQLGVGYGIAGKIKSYGEYYSLSTLSSSYKTISTGTEIENGTVIDLSAGLRF